VASALTAAGLVDVAVTRVETVWVGPPAAGAAAALGWPLYRVPLHGGLWAPEREAFAAAITEVLQA